jgi:hypothetical protein
LNLVVLVEFLLIHSVLMNAGISDEKR